MPKSTKPFSTWLVAAIILIPLVTAVYIRFRPQVFELMASGSQWILVTCGFADSGDILMQDDRWRKLYYAIRMFKGTPPRELSPEDARADRQYPGMGFGVVHTFSKTPVPRVIGGWLFSIPCAYFSDARDCQETNANIAHLKVGIGDWAPISPETVDQFLVANSAETIRVTIMGLGQHPASWWQIDPSGLKLLPDPPAGYRKYALAGMNDDHYQLYLPSKPNGYHHQFQCTDPQWAEQKRIMDHCLMRFMYRDSVAVEIKFSAQARDQWPRLREATEKLVGTFQVRR